MQSKPTWLMPFGRSITSAFSFGRMSASGKAGRSEPPEMNAMNESTQTMAEQIAQAATAFQQQRTGHEPKSVSVVLSGDTLVVTLHGALSPAEQAMAQTPARRRQGAGVSPPVVSQRVGHAPAGNQADHRNGRREATAEVEPTSGAVVQVFTSGTMVQVFLLSGKLPSENFSN